MSDSDRRTVLAAFAASSFIAEKLAISPDETYAIFGNAFKVEDGAIVGYDPDGHVLLSLSHPDKVADFDDALSHLVKHFPKRDYLLKGTGASGSGARGSGSSSNYVAQPNAPDWSIYKYAVSLLLDDVIALSCNIYEPEQFRESNSEFVRRRKIAYLRLDELQRSPIGILTKTDWGQLIWKYSLPDFRQWGEDFGWSFPDEFPRIKAGALAKCSEDLSVEIKHHLYTTKLLKIIDSIRDEIGKGTNPNLWTREAIETRARELDSSLSQRDVGAIGTVLVLDEKRGKGTPLLRSAVTAERRKRR